MSMVAQPAKKNTGDRALRAWQEAPNYELLPTIGAPDAYLVVGPRGYYVTTCTSCDCPDSTQRGTVCKHQHLVRLHEQQISEMPKPAPAPAPETREEFRARMKARMAKDFPD
jgi:hypothetical protein